MKGLILSNILFIGCEDVAHGTDEYYECMIRVLTEPFHHAAGTECSRVADQGPIFKIFSDPAVLVFFSKV